MENTNNQLLDVKDSSKSEHLVKMDTRELETERTVEQKKTLVEGQPQDVDNQINTKVQEISRLTESIQREELKIIKAREELGLSPSVDGSVSIASKKDLLDKTQKEQEILEKQKKEIVTVQLPKVESALNTQERKFEGWQSGKDRASYKENREKDGVVKVYRGINPQIGKTKADYSDAKINPLDWVTTDRMKAQTYAGEDGVVLEQDLPSLDIFRQNRSSQKPKFVYVPEGYSPLDSVGSVGGIGKDGPTPYSNKIFKKE